MLLSTVGRWAAGFRFTHSRGTRQPQPRSAVQAIGHGQPDTYQWKPEFPSNAPVTEATFCPSACYLSPYSRVGSTAMQPAMSRRTGQVLVSGRRG
jgi:hypothetical protein